jgi:chemotaxis protein histidine kinase CheA/ActR/RegA family two-component response regulator
MASPGGKGSDNGGPLGEWNPSEAELLRGLFLDEAEKHLRQISEAQQSLARAADANLQVAPELVDALFRHLHTLKGAAGSVSHDAIARAAHELEELCAEIRTGKLAPTFGILERIDEGISALRALLTSARLAAPPSRAIDPPETTAPSNPPERRRQIERRAVADRRSSAEGMLRVDAERLDVLLDGVGDLVILRTRLDRRGEELESVLRDMRAVRQTLRASLDELETDVSSDQSRDQDARIRVLDRLGEIEVALSTFTSYLDRTTRALASDGTSMRLISEKLEDQIRRARLVPMEWAYSRLGSAMRELERSCHRPVDMIISGGEVELDKSLIDQLVDPLMHLLRNALAHGIEAPEVRQQRGKPARGRIEIRTVQEGDCVFITFSDDGGGIDRNAVQQTLRRTGRLRADENLDDKSLRSMVFEPGFSTRTNSDSLAGRGMGLNIVERTIAQMGGESRLEFEPGMYTRFRLSVPLSAKITQALLFKLGGQVYSVPSTHVAAARSVGPSELAGNSLVVPLPARQLDEPTLPLLRLHALLGVELPPGRRAAALQVRYGGRDFCFTCDKIIGPRTVVIRPPGPLLGLMPLYAGVTISGAGKAQLVLDLGALAEAAFSPPPLNPSPPRRGQPRVLLVDDSRMARESAGRLLSAAGFQTVGVEDGWDAWDILGERRFDAVVTGLEMPRVDGFQLIARIRHEPTLRGLPIVVLSSRTSQSTRQRALDAGADVFLPKSRHKRSLVEAVRSCLQKNAAQPGQDSPPQ